MTNSDIGQNLENIRNLLDIDAPEGNNADDMFEDVLKHNLWGIHIKLENDALSDTNPHVCIKLVIWIIFLYLMQSTIIFNSKRTRL